MLNDERYIFRKRGKLAQKKEEYANQMEDALLDNLANEIERIARGKITEEDLEEGGFNKVIERMATTAPKAGMNYSSNPQLKYPTLPEEEAYDEEDVPSFYPEYYERKGSVQKRGEATFLEMPGVREKVNPPKIMKDMEVEEYSEEELPMRFQVGARVVHVPSRKYGLVIDHGSNNPLLAIVQFDDGSIKIVNMNELALEGEFEHSIYEKPNYTSPGIETPEERIERIKNEYTPQQTEAENPFSEKIERIKMVVKEVLTDPMVSQRIVTYLTEKGLLDIDVQDFLKQLDILKISSVDKLKIATKLSQIGVINKKASVLLLNELLSGGK